MKSKIKSISIRKGQTVRDALKAIERGALGIALVIDEDKKFCGLVTDGDVRRAFLAGSDKNTPIDTIMQRNAVTTREGMSKEEILKLMNSAVRHIPILDKDNRVVDLASYIHYFNIPVAEPSLEEKEMEYVQKCITTNWISSAGQYVEDFERNFSDFCNTKYGIATCNGTAALHLALTVLGIGQGDEVIVPTMSFIATANAVTYTGAKPVFVDSSIDTWNINPDKIEEAITQRAKAIIAVHLYGHPADMDPILEIARKYNLHVIEDAAEAHGAEYKGRKVGSLGDIGCFSFYGNKIITTGEGGMVVTNSAPIMKMAKILRNHGMSPKKRYWHSYIGFNYRLTNIQAAIGVAQLERIETFIESKRRNAFWYTELLKNIPGITLPAEQEWAKSVYWMYSVLIEENYSLSRDELIERLAGKGIESRPIFYPIHTMPPYLDKKQSFPIAEEISRKGISLPSAVGLTQDEIKRVVKSIILK